MRIALVFMLLLSLPALAGAQPSGERLSTRAAPLADDVVRVVTHWGMDSGSAQLRVPGVPAAELYDGVGAATLVAGHDQVLVAYATEGAHSAFLYRIVRREGGHASLGEVVRVERLNTRRDVPFSVVATATADGFAIFYQEIQADDPSAAHTYLVRVGADGAALGAAREVAVPWSLAAAIDNGHGFHLALIYPGDANGMRLSMVALDTNGRPQQHPDWSSRPGMIDDVHLVRHGAAIVAFYRGGDGGDRLLERDVTSIGSWGQNPPAARDHGRLRQSEAILIRVHDGAPSADHVPASAD